MIFAILAAAFQYEGIPCFQQSLLQVLNTELGIQDLLHRCPCMVIVVLVHQPQHVLVCCLSSAIRHLPYLHFSSMQHAKELRVAERVDFVMPCIIQSIAVGYN